jgi:hypothetical protein
MEIVEVTTESALKLQGLCVPLIVALTPAPAFVGSHTCERSFGKKRTDMSVPTKNRMLGVSMALLRSSKRSCGIL